MTHSTDMLATVAQKLVENYRGLLAADESTSTITKRFKAIGVESTEESRRLYRELLFTTPSIEEYISGVIMYDETIHQKDSSGTPFPQLLSQKGIMPGIKVDTGAKPLAHFPEETITEGLDGLRERLAKYHELGARFAKWRAVIKIDENLPSPFCIEANAQALARYAALCQEAGIVPIVEPEILMDGDHTIETCQEITSFTWQTVFNELYRHRVEFEGILLKPSMVIAGKDCKHQASVDEVAERTVYLLTQHVPASVPGIVFLSGGQNPALATQHLNAMNAIGPFPWYLSYSYGRALQEPALNTWKGKTENVAKAQHALLDRAQKNSAACAGSYSVESEKMV